ncbi:hypothetical protein EV127DRAFT_514454 [Xylaria flabelliformis]|nr:hypothetical protein EV127DRAFT_514454 [Xylaria flabelliformis]
MEAPGAVATLGSLPPTTTRTTTTIVTTTTVTTPPNSTTSTGKTPPTSNTYASLSSNATTSTTNTANPDTGTITTTRTVTTTTTDPPGITSTSSPTTTTSFTTTTDRLTGAITTETTTTTTTTMTISLPISPSMALPSTTAADLSSSTGLPRRKRKPGLSMPPREVAFRSGLASGIEMGAGSSLIAAVDQKMGVITSLIGRLDVMPSDLKQALTSGIELKKSIVSPCEVAISLGRNPPPGLCFAVFVEQSSRKLRIARRRSYVVVVLQVAECSEGMADPELDLEDHTLNFRFLLT